MTNTDQQITEAAATLYRLTQSAALSRMYRKAEGHDATSPQALEEWAVTHVTGKIQPSAADRDVVIRQNPELVRLANLSNPYLQDLY